MKYPIMKQVLQTKNLKDEKHEYLFNEINFYFYAKEFTKLGLKTQIM